MRIEAALATALLGWATAWAGCAPEQLVKVVLRVATPGVDPHSFLAQPKTVYRLGTKYGRVEEVPDAGHGVHGLVVVSEPDAWLVNLLDKTAKHIVDTGAPYAFHFPVFGNPDDPDFAKGFEVGCEVDYLKEKGAGPPKPKELNGRSLDGYSATEGEYQIVLLVDHAMGKPVAASLLKSGTIMSYIRYVEYERSLPANPALFVLPKDLNVTEAK